MGIEEAEKRIAELEARDAIAEKEWQIEKAKTFRQRLEEDKERFKNFKIYQRTLFHKTIEKYKPELITKEEELFKEYIEGIIDEKIRNLKEFLDIPRETKVDFINHGN
jgi:hypothetical protein